MHHLIRRVIINIKRNLKRLGDEDRRQKTEDSMQYAVRSKQKNHLLDTAYCLLPTAYLLVFASMLLLFADNVNAAGCTLLEPAVLKRYIENKSYNMFLFDVRPRFDSDMKRKFDLSTNMKRIPRTMWLSINDIEKELVGKGGEFIGKDVILIGENTESAESVCRDMMKKGYGIRNIYVLKGGIEKWDGPVAEDITTVKCKIITSRELINIIKSNREVEIIDQRQEEEDHDGHIPAA